MTYTVASSCVCTSPLVVMTIVGLQYPFSASLKSFLLIICIDAPESTTNSLSSGFNVDAGRHLFSEGEKNVALSWPLNFNTFLTSFHAASRAPCSCHSVSSCERSSNFGALGLRWWGSPGQIYPSEGFWSRTLVWRALAFVIFTRWIGLCMFVFFRKTDFGGFMSWNTQPNCRASDDWRLDDFCPNFLSLLFPSFSRRSWHSSVTVSLSCQFPVFSIATALVIILFGLSRLFINLAMRIRALFSKSATSLGLVEQAFWRMPLLHRMNWCNFLWGKPCRAIETVYRWGFYLWDFGFSMIFAHSAAWKNSETDLMVNFSHAYSHRGGNCNCLLSHIARWFPIANNLQEFFGHAVLSADSWPRRSSQNSHSWPQNSCFEFLVRYFSSPKFSICDNQLLISSDESPDHTIPIRCWVFQTLVFLICTILPRCHQVGFLS